MSEPRSSYHHGDLRRALLDATLEILGEHGVESFTLREAARRAGVNHRAVYRHFEDKTSLLVEIAAQGYRELVARMRAAQQDGADLEQEMHMLALAYVRFSLEQPAYFRVMNGPRLNEDGRFPDYEREVQAVFALMLAMVERAKQEHGFEGRSDHGVMALWSAIVGLTTLILQGRVTPPPRDVAKFTRRVLTPTIRGLLR
ncbi:MAG TPA: TetR/AcrR family transcriptional regulator [Polyangiales bacterium]|nr:TetR/AcrR family transcriptional regulator [Polyangiales bacterium]